MAEATDAAYADLDTWRGLTRLFEWYCEHMAIDRGFGELMLEIPGVSERFATLRERITPMVLRLIDKAVAEGVVRPGIAASDLFAMVTMVEAIASFAEPVDPGTLATAATCSCRCTDPAPTGCAMSWRPIAHDAARPPRLMRITEFLRIDVAAH